MVFGPRVYILSILSISALFPMWSSPLPILTHFSLGRRDPLNCWSRKSSSSWIFPSRWWFSWWWRRISGSLPHSSPREGVNTDLALITSCCGPAYCQHPQMMLMVMMEVVMVMMEVVIAIISIFWALQASTRNSCKQVSKELMICYCTTITHEEKPKYTMKIKQWQGGQWTPAKIVDRKHGRLQKTK